MQRQSIVASSSVPPAWGSAKVAVERMVQMRLRAGLRVAKATVVDVQAHGDSHLVTYEVQLHGGESRHRVAVVAKFSTRPGSEAAYDVLRRLRSAGFRPPSPFAVPRPIGYSKAWGMLLQEHIAGTSWRDCLLVGGRAVSSLAAEWLARLQRLPPAPEAKASDRDEADHAMRYGDELGATLPAALGARTRALAARLGPELADPEGAEVPSHGDYHPKNVLLASGRLYVLDFDSFAAREPGYDVGYAIAQVCAMSRTPGAGLARGAAAADVFWHRYGGLCGRAAWRRVLIQASRAMLQILHYTVCVKGSTDLADSALLCSTAERWFLSAMHPTTNSVVGRSNRRRRSV
jgi:aminoglycoside phosphotransferase (APT) family kinase protein